MWVEWHGSTPIERLLFALTFSLIFYEPFSIPNRPVGKLLMKREVIRLGNSAILSNRNICLAKEAYDAGWQGPTYLIRHGIGSTIENLDRPSHKRELHGQLVHHKEEKYEVPHSLWLVSLRGDWSFEHLKSVSQSNKKHPKEGAFSAQKDIDFESMPTIVRRVGCCSTMNWNV